MALGVAGPRLEAQASVVVDSASGARPLDLDPRILCILLSRPVLGCPPHRAGYVSHNMKMLNCFRNGILWGQAAGEGS